MTDQIPSPAAPQGAPVAINAQYIRDLSFENPNAPQIMAEMRQPPQIEVKVDVKVRNLAEHVFEVVLAMSATAKVAEKTAFVVELEYGAVVTLAADLPQEHVGAVLLIEIPRMLFPFARQIIGDATRDGGFPPLLLNPIDFADLYRRQQAQQQQQAGPGGGIIA
ncbi:MAG: protein-export chaperone SecB [Alphaproteobacteria bacterium]|nr:protein-export chaperone SecB [Alphaproteobacteria bacterium]